MSSISGLPALTGNPLFVTTLPELTTYRGKLLSSVNQGTPVHAASFIRRREIVFETELLKKPDLPSILVHELFHFVWVRLGNAKRTAYTALLAKELRAQARGELGESAAVRKQFASGSRDYVCESFCDTAAWLYGPNTQSPHVNLGRRWRRDRKAWFEANFQGAVKC